MFFYVVENNMMNVQGLWVSLVMILLLLSLCVPGVFLGAIIVFYVPIILVLLYTIAQLISPVLLSVAFMGLVLCLV